ncbi:class I SAM-dependent methyltransferase [bacterium]|nr:class I SAM-dependent methyltransferase [bacterium]
MNTSNQTVYEHYHRNGLLQSVLTALQAAGKDIKNLTRRDLRAFDEFHIRGLEATRELARLAKFHERMKILDLGCGIGGPARALAAEFDCSVVGIDLIESYCSTAAELTRLVGLQDQVSFQQCDIAQLPFPDQSFDGVWSLHSIMNTPALSKTISEIRRVLRPSGIYAFYEVCAGKLSPPLFPVPWAGNEQMSFLISPEEFQVSLESKGCSISEWQDNSEVCLNWFRKRVAKLKTQETPPGPGMELLMGDNMIEKSANVVRNLEEQRIRVIMGTAIVRM